MELDCDQANAPSESVRDLLLAELRPQLVPRAQPTPRIECSIAGIRAAATEPVHALIRDLMGRIEYVPIKPHVLVAAEEIHHLGNTRERAERPWLDAALRAASQAIRDRVDRLDAARRRNHEDEAQSARRNVQGSALNQVLRVRVRALTADSSDYDPFLPVGNWGPARSKPSLLSYTEHINLRTLVAREDGYAFSAPIELDLRRGEHRACALGSEVLLRIRFDGVSTKREVALAVGMWTDRDGELRFAPMQALTPGIRTAVFVAPEDGLTAVPTCERIVALLIEIVSSDGASAPVR